MILKMCVCYALLYGSETWALTEMNTKKASYHRNNNGKKAPIVHRYMWNG